MMLSLLAKMKIKGLSLVSLYLLAVVILVPLHARAEPVVEVMHWMHRGSDARAMRVLIDEFESKGGIWHNVAGKTSVDVLNSAVSRMAKGYAPTFVQWNSAWEVAQIRKLGLLNEVDKELSESLENTLIENVLDMVKVDNEIVSVPINVHTENWLWYRKQNEASIDPDVFADWANFLAYAKGLQDENRYALALGNEPWQIRTLFNNILLGETDQEMYERIYNKLDTSVFQEKKLRHALQVFKELKPFSHSFGDGRWDQQVAAVAANRATAMVTGDWAKGEFKKLGLKLGRDYECLLAPGTSDNIVLTIDAFVLGQVVSDSEKEGQKLLVDVVTDPDVSETFNYLKGSFPPIKGIGIDSLDHCNQQAYTMLNQKGKAIKAYANTGDRGFLANLDHLISELWNGNLEIDEWIEEFTSALDTERNKRSENYRVSGK